MLRSLLLTSLVIAIVVLVQTQAAAAYSASLVTLTDLRKRGHSNAAKPAPESPALKDFNDRAKIGVPDPAKSMELTLDITAYMNIGILFYAVQLPNHQPGVDDQQVYLTGDPSDVSNWPDGAYSQARWCAEAANQTLFDAMQKCGPKETCDADFITLSYWGTAKGMNWKQDGLMLYTCVAYQTVKSRCPDPSKPPCKLNVVGDFHTTMWPSNNNVKIIGTGAKSMSQMALQIKEYNQKHHTNYALPIAGKKKRSEQRRLLEDRDADGTAGDVI